MTKGLYVFWRRYLNKTNDQARAKIFYIQLVEIIDELFASMSVLFHKHF